jgi:iron complex outermembrane recepter protein
MLNGRRSCRPLLWLLLATCLIGTPRIAFGQIQAPVPAPSSTTSNLKRLSLDDLLNVEITSVSRHSERLFDAPASIYVIGSEDIRRSGATTLPEVLRLAPNLTVANVGRTGPAQQAISARGFNNNVGNKLLVLIDGRTVYTPLFSGVFWDQQDVLLSDIDRIEVISGPGATLWGANAVNGVINVITKPASETQSGVGSATLGSFTREVALRWGGTVRAVSYRAYAKFGGWDHTKQANGADLRNAWHRRQGGFRADWGSSRDTVTVQGDAYTGGSEHRGFVGAIEVPALEVSGFNVTTRWTRRLQGSANMQLQAYIDQSDRNDIVLFGPKAALFDVEFQHSSPIGRHRFTWGSGYRRAHDRIDPAAFSRFIPDSRTLNWGNVFVHGEMRLSRRVGATIGTKLERNDYTGLEHLPSARVTWKMSETHLLWGGVSRAVRAPSRYDREVFSPMNPPYRVIGGPNFRSEVANVFETGYRARPLETVSYSVTVFTHLWDGLRSGTGVPVQIENGIEGPIHGVEAWATYRPIGPWSLSAGSTLLSEHLRLKRTTTDPGALNNPTLRNDPDYQWMLRSNIDVRHNVELDVYLRGVASLPNPTVPAFAEADVRVAWRPKPSVEVAVNGRDLLHDSHPEFGAVPGRSEVPRRVSVDLKTLF